ncbi:MAG: hypothetical protein HYX69_19910 [Planctomycetia bacterium]|nr:hypothetical protein [Planctomycetia bacterium]
MLPDITAEELALVLDRAAARVLRQAAILAPPVDAIRLARSLGIETAVDRRQDARARYVELASARGGAPRPAILLRPEPRVERRHWAVAHEIGEQQAVTVFECLAIDPRTAPEAAREWVANQLAGRLLLPTRWLGRAGAECDWDLAALKERFSTASHELILRRMLDFAAPIVTSVYDHDELSFRRANFAGRLPPVTTAERDCRHAAHESGQVQEQTTIGYRMRSWPVHEEGWKRELVRVDVLINSE